MILIDSAAGSRDLITMPPLNDSDLATLANLSVSADTKSSADICFSGNGPNSKVLIGIEFKSLSDLLTSLHNGRLNATQLQTMTSDYSICWLLYYGRYRRGASGMLEFVNDKHKHATYLPYTFIGSKPLPWSYLQSSLMTLHAAGISSQHFDTREECAQWIATLYRWWQKPWDKHHSMRTFDKSTDMKSIAIMPGIDSFTRDMMEFIRQFPGMGFERAYAAATHFSCLEDMIKADANEWAKIPGVGKTIARATVEKIRRRRDPA